MTAYATTITVIVVLLLIDRYFKERSHKRDRDLQDALNTKVIHFAEGMAERDSQERRELANKIIAPKETVARSLAEFEMEPIETVVPDMGPWSAPQPGDEDD